MTHADFIQSFAQLKSSLPKPATFSLGNENSDYTSYVYNSSNCYFCFDCTACKNCLYCFDCVRLVDCVDCDFCVDSELLYSCLDCFKAYHSTYLDYCSRVYDSHFCWDCSDSHDLFGCTHVKNKQYCIFNRQYAKEEYLKKVNSLLLKPAEDHSKELKELIKKYPMGSTNVSNSENSDYGNHVHYANNCYVCFDVSRSEDCGYSYDCAFCKDSYDVTQCYKAELCYMCNDSGKIYNCDFTEWSSDCFDCSYLVNCKDCHNCFGCVGLTHKKFCILNKQYSKDDYESIKAEIVTSRLQLSG